MNTPLPMPLTRRHQSGVVLPIALIMLVIISFAGLLAARNSATHEQFSNNMRTNQVARQLAEEALRYCERVAMDDADETGTVFTDEVKNKIVDIEIESEAVDEIKKGAWNEKANWIAGAIEVTPNYGTNAAGKATPNNPLCIIQKLKTDRYLVTARGFSADAVIDGGALTSGSEVWLQSILSPCIPLKSENNGLGSASCS
jgi:type IV pilus assembly protein PilX